MFAFRQYRRQGADEALAGWTLAAVFVAASVTLGVGGRGRRDRGRRRGSRARPGGGDGGRPRGGARPGGGLPPAPCPGVVGLGVGARHAARGGLAPGRARRPGRRASSPGSPWSPSMSGRCSPSSGGGWPTGSSTARAWHCRFWPSGRGSPGGASSSPTGPGQLAANLPITPGGLGVVEGSLTIALVALRWGRDLDGGGGPSVQDPELLGRAARRAGSTWGVLVWSGRPATPTARLPEGVIEEAAR